MDRTANPKTLWITTLILLLAAITILSLIDAFSMWYDELYMIFRIDGGLERLLHEREVGWPPGYQLLLYSWTRLAGHSEVVVKAFNGFMGLLATAFIYRAGRRLGGVNAGWLAALAFGTSGYIAYFSAEVRAYTLSILLAAILSWLHLYWLARPNLKRSALYALTATLWLYTHFSAMMIIPLAGLHVLLAAPRRLWRWIAIMVVVGVAFLPILPNFLDFTRIRANAIEGADRTNLPTYFYQGLKPVYQAYSHGHDLLLAAILALAGIGLVLYVQRSRRVSVVALAWLIIWGVGLPLFIYLTRFDTLAFSTRYVVIAAPAAFLVAGAGLGRLPRRWRGLGAVMLVVLAMQPWSPFRYYRLPYEDSPPVRDLVREMAERFRPGDTLVVDPGVDLDPLGTWYYESLYFPGGRIPRADDGDEAKGSVWYLVRQGSEDPAVMASVEQGRVRNGEFWGPWYFIATYYEKPPLPQGYPVGSGGMRYHGAIIEPDQDVYGPGDTIRVTSWWSTSQALPADYSIGLFLIRRTDGILIVQNSSGPTGALSGAQTSLWQPGALYRDEREITLPWDSGMEFYRLWLVVYNSLDGERLMPSPELPQTDNALIIHQFKSESWAFYDH